MAAAFVVQALCTLAAAQQSEIKLNPAKTSVVWTLGDVLHTVKGRFRLKSGEIIFDPRSGTASGQVVVDATSGNSANGMRDSKMKKEVLESGRYPEIVFSPKHMRGYVAGQESVVVQLAGVRGTVVDAHTTFTVPYEQWGMKNPSTLFLKVGNMVEISISTTGDLQTAGGAGAPN